MKNNVCTKKMLAKFMKTISKSIKSSKKKVNYFIWHLITGTLKIFRIQRHNLKLHPSNESSWQFCMKF